MPYHLSATDQTLFLKGVVETADPYRKENDFTQKPKNTPKKRIGYRILKAGGLAE